MKIHAIRTGTVSIHEKQRRGKGRGMMRLVNAILDRTWTDPLPIYAWLIEHPDGLMVVDTGETAASSRRGYFPWWHPYFRMAVRCHVAKEEEVGPQLRALGFAPEDVRWVVLTHLHTDHAGGLHHFPSAEILVSRREFKAATGVTGRLRGFLPNRWPSWFSPRLVEFEGGPVGPFERSFALTSDVVLVPTHGHTVGHMSVILNHEGARLFFAGDASYTEQFMLDGVVDGVAPDERAARDTLRRIASYAREQPTVYLPAHDPESGERLAARRTVAVI